MNDAFAAAVALLTSGRFDAKPLITRTLPPAAAIKAFEIASDRNRAIKAHLDLARGRAASAPR